MLAYLGFFATKFVICTLVRMEFRGGIAMQCRCPRNYLFDWEGRRYLKFFALEIKYFGGRDSLSLHTFFVNSLTLSFVNSLFHRLSGYVVELALAEDVNMVIEDHLLTIVNCEL